MGAAFWSMHFGLAREKLAAASNNVPWSKKYVSNTRPQLWPLNVCRITRTLCPHGCWCSARHKSALLCCPAWSRRASNTGLRRRKGQGYGKRQLFSWWAVEVCLKLLKINTKKMQRGGCEIPKSSRQSQQIEAKFTSSLHPTPRSSTKSISHRSIYSYQFFIQTVFLLAFRFSWDFFIRDHRRWTAVFLETGREWAWAMFTEWIESTKHAKMIDLLKSHLIKLCIY